MPLTSNPSPGDRYIDSHALRNYLYSLQSEREAALEEFKEDQEGDTPSLPGDTWQGDNEDAKFLDSSDWDAEREDHYQTLSAIENDIPRDTQLIRDDVWEEYVEDLARNIYNIDTRAWPYCHIDWEAAAKALASDYSQLEWDGHTYYFRD